MKYLLLVRIRAGNCFYLTNRFHVAVRFNRSQMTSKCGKNKKVACVTDVRTIF